MRHALLSLGLLLQSICVSSSPPYTITQYVEISVQYTVTYRASSSSASYRTVANSYIVTPQNSPTNILRTLTDTTSYPEVTILQIVLPYGSVPTTTRPYNVTYPNPLETVYLVPITYRPSTNCSQTWTHVTNVPVSIPTILRGIITPTSVSSAAVTFPSAYSMTFSSLIAVLNPTDVPSNLLSRASNSGEPYGLKSCAKPTTSCYTRTATSPPSAKTTACSVSFNYDYKYSGSGSSVRDAEWDAWWRTTILIVVLVPVLWSVLFLILGLIESWYAFKGLMLGKRRKRGTPYAWCCISWFFLCCVGPTYKAKSAEEQAILEGRWKELSSGKKLALFAKWGFKWSYPDVLGSEPDVEKKAFRTRVFGTG